MEIPFLANLVSYYVSLSICLQALLLTNTEKAFALVAGCATFMVLPHLFRIHNLAFMWIPHTEHPEYRIKARGFEKPEAGSQT
jgi:hypothetical protein